VLSPGRSALRRVAEASGCRPGRRRRRDPAEPRRGAQLAAFHHGGLRLGRAAGGDHLPRRHADLDPRRARRAAGGARSAVSSGETRRTEEESPVWESVPPPFESLRESLLRWRTAARETATLRTAG